MPLVYQRSRKLVVGRTSLLDWLVGCFGFNGPLDSISVYIGPSPKEREKEKRKDR